MSNVNTHPNEHLPKVRKNRTLWGIVAMVVVIAFLLMWTLQNYGTPANPGVPDPAVNNPPPVPSATQ